MIKKFIVLLSFVFLFNNKMQSQEAEKEILVFCLMAEGRGEGKQGIDAIANIIVNRYNNNKKYKKISEVCVEKYQFSCFLEENKIKNQINKEIKKNNKETIEVYEYCNLLAENILNNKPIKRVLHKNTLHYCRFDSLPHWRDNSKIDKKIGNHLFFKDII